MTTYPTTTPEAYAAKLYRKFGVDTSQPGSAAALAKLENLAMQQYRDIVNGSTLLPARTKPRKPAVEIFATIAALIGQGVDTPAALASAMKRDNSTVYDHLRGMVAAGMVAVTGVTGKGARVYALQEAAE